MNRQRELPTGAPDVRAGAGQYLAFLHGAEMFGISIVGIKEIIEYAPVTEVPMMPPAIRGVINLRGAVVPVVDLGLRFGRASAGVTRRTCIVVVEGLGEDARDIGIVVDAVSAVLEIPAQDIEPAPSFGAQLRPDFIAGLAKVNGRFVILLDLAQVLSITELASAVLAGGAADGQPAGARQREAQWPA